MKIGITGQRGFIGGHLANTIKLQKEFEIIPFEIDFFNSKYDLDKFVKQCDVIIHLAGLNRHHDSTILYNTNIILTQKLIQSLKDTGSTPHIIFSSSLQEYKDNPYGKSKKIARELLENWARDEKANYTGLIIPNVFGPFGKPFYNSFISTFCYQLTHDQKPKIDIDTSVPLIYINDLVKIILTIIKNQINNPEYQIMPQCEKRVGEVLSQLEEYKKLYLEQGIIPSLNDDFEIALFNTFRNYIEYFHYPVKLDIKNDNRGFLVEIIKSYCNGQMFYSSTKPGITRGNHFHTRKIERFCVLQGNAIIKWRRVGTTLVKEYKVSGKNPVFLDMPIWHTHNITNIGHDELLTLFWTNEIFNSNDTDTFYENVELPEQIST